MMKNNKKGFTLVELIAVIAILSILLIMALPQVLNLYNDTKEGAFITQVQSVYKAAEEKFVSDQLLPDAAGSNVTYCHDNKEETNDLGVTNDDVLYKIVFENGKITSIMVMDSSYLYTSPAVSDGGYIKVSDIVFDDAEAVSSTNQNSIACS